MVNKTSSTRVARLFPVRTLFIRLLFLIGLRVPIGYQDGNGFHPGIQDESEE